MRTLCSLGLPARGGNAISGSHESGGAGAGADLSCGFKPDCYLRSAAAIREHPSDAIQATLVLNGRLQASQDQRRSAILPGHMVLYDAGRPFAPEIFDDYQALTLQCATGMLAFRVPQVQRCTAVDMACQADAAAVVRATFEMLAMQASRPGSQGLDHLLSIFLDRVAGLFMPHGSEPASADRRWQALLASIKTYIGKYLARPELSVAEIARIHAITPRTLNRLFATENITAVRWIQLQRLEHARQLWRTDEAGWVSQAAWLAGFSDLTHFGRIFRRHYGYRPSDMFRASALQPPLMEGRPCRAST